MAYLIPDNLASRKDVAEPIRRVARALAAGCEDDVTVWYEPLFDPAGRHPHLVVLEPRVGVVVLEVLSGRDPVPPERADELAATLRKALVDHPTLASVPVGAAVALPGLDRDEAAERGLDGVLDLDRCLFKPDLDAALRDGEAGGVLRWCARAVGATGTPLDEELSAAQVAELRGVIHPDVVIRGSRERSSGALFTAGTGSGGDGGEDRVKVLDRQQEAFAKSLGDGHRIIRGVAGSGKTLVLVHRARLMARLRPDRRILVTCFTRSLASMLRGQLAEHRNVDVVHLDKLMARVIRRAGVEHPGYRDGGRAVAAAALESVQRTRWSPYGAVLIDEAQDFDTDALRFCVALLASADPDDQDLIVVADSAQNVFRRNFRWKDAGIRAQGRTRVLRVNYRNTREILDFAHRFLTADPAIPVDEVPDPEDELSIIPASSAERSGPVPTVAVAATADEEVRLVVDLVCARLGQRPAASRSVAVLHGDVPYGRGFDPRRLVRALRAAGVPVFWVTDPQQRDNRDRAGSAGEPVIVSTVQSAKGLEFPDVVVCGLGARDGDLVTARKLLYVGFTRAVDHLAVVVGSDSPFRDDARTSLG